MRHESATSEKRTLCIADDDARIALLRARQLAQIVPVAMSSRDQVLIGLSLELCEDLGCALRNAS